MVHSQFCLMLWPMCGCFWPESESWFCWYSNYNLWVRRKQMVPPLMGPLFGITPLNALAMEAPSLTMGSFFNYYFSFYDLIVSSTICHGYSCFTVWFWLCAFQPSLKPPFSVCQQQGTPVSHPVITTATKAWSRRHSMARLSQIIPVSTTSCSQ